MKDKKLDPTHNTGRPYQRLVAYVAKAMSPDSSIEEGKWIEGPDGTRDMDVVVSGTLEGKGFSILIECKDYDIRKSGPIGISYIDAIDSKRHDLPVDAAIICSNSGFTAPAIRKAKRKNIGLVSILKMGDPMVKVEILEEIYTRRIKLKTINVDFGIKNPQNIPLTEVFFQGKKFIRWVYNRIALILGSNYAHSGLIHDKLRLKKPIPLVLGEKQVFVPKLDISFDFESKWFSQVVSLDASLGMYDYLRGRVILARDEAQYVIKGIDVHNGEPIDFTPKRDDLMAGLVPGDVLIDLILFEGFDLPKNPKAVPNIDPYIVEQDLNLRISE